MPSTVTLPELSHRWLQESLGAITGHSSPAMLKKYIRADSLDVVKQLTDKYDYFN